MKKALINKKMPGRAPKKFLRILLVDIIPTLVLLTAMACAMAYIASHLAVG